MIMPFFLYTRFYFRRHLLVCSADALGADQLHDLTPIHNGHELTRQEARTRVTRHASSSLDLDLGDVPPALPGARHGDVQHAVLDLGGDPVGARVVG